MTRLELLAQLEDEVQRPVPPPRRVRQRKSDMEIRIRQLERRVLELESRAMAHRCRPVVAEYEAQRRTA